MSEAKEPRTEAGKALALRLSRHALFADEAVSAIEEQAATEARHSTLDEVLRGLRSEDDSTQLRAIIASVEALR